MRKFTMVPGDLWALERFRALPSDLHRYLYIYLLANGHQNCAGLYYLPAGYGATDLGWTPEEYIGRRQARIDADLIKFDANTDEVMIVDWFLWNPATGLKVTLAIDAVLRRTRSPELRAALTTSVEDAKAAGMPKPSSIAAPYDLSATAHIQKAARSK